jgi:hypothetical protein
MPWCRTTSRIGFYQRSYASNLGSSSYAMKQCMMVELSVGLEWSYHHMLSSLRVGSPIPLSGAQAQRFCLPYPMDIRHGRTSKGNTRVFHLDGSLLLSMARRSNNTVKSTDIGIVYALTSNKAHCGQSYYICIQA